MYLFSGYQLRLMDFAGVMDLDVTTVVATKEVRWFKSISFNLYIFCYKVAIAMVEYDIAE